MAASELSRIVEVKERIGLSLTCAPAVVGDKGGACVPGLSGPTIVSSPKHDASFKTVGRKPALNANGLKAVAGSGRKQAVSLDVGDLIVKDPPSKLSGKDTDALDQISTPHLALLNLDNFPLLQELSTKNERSKPKPSLTSLLLARASQEPSSTKVSHNGLESKAPALDRSSTAQDERSLLCPSAAPTPRNASNTSAYGSLVVRPARIMAPSRDAANDMARIRNGGVPLQPRRFQRTHSAPELCSAEATSTSADPAELAPKTPRSVRGLVRRVSKVCCSYPVLPPQPVQLARPTLRAAGRGAVENTPSSPSSPTSPETARLRKSVSTKRVSFAEHVDEGARVVTPSVALSRSLNMMSSLYDLRRVATDDAAATEAQEALLHSTLGELVDSEASLSLLYSQLDTGYNDATKFGGSRHATAIISARTLAVVQRKMSLLHDVEARAAAFQAAHARREELIIELMQSEVFEPPADLLGIQKFIWRFTHKSASGVPGSPADADKSDFAAFASSFKLPSKHSQLERLRVLSEQISQWWAEAALRVAEEGASYNQIRRVFTISLGAGAGSDHPYLLRATKILNDRLADKVLQEAEERQRSDTVAFGDGTKPMVGPASYAADAIEQALKQVISEGVPESDHRLVRTKAICKELREADNQRKRLVARQKRLQAAGQGS